MNVPRPLREAANRGEVVHTDDRDDAIVVDLGASAADASVDVLDGTAIVVTDDDQFEFDLPPEATNVTIHNGVLTIRADR